jgi:hypothetical protein
MIKCALLYGADCIKKEYRYGTVQFKVPSDMIVCTSTVQQYWYRIIPNFGHFHNFIVDEFSDILKYNQQLIDV